FTCSLAQNGGSFFYFGQSDTTSKYTIGFRATGLIMFDKRPNCSNQAKIREAKTRLVNLFQTRQTSYNTTRKHLLN
ncbi:MAG TPA: hypothetical protein VE089_07500, partial [Nitrososphaeraceae archaeon]|nr:hypothetical protein [Nitrososphaeraceae archaeon]